MLKGKVKLWQKDKGWGFIEGDDGFDYFFNISNVRNGQKIEVNSEVKYDAFESQRGPEAENISIC